MRASGDDRLVAATGRLVHDVKIRGVEGEGGGGQTVSDKVHPEQLDGNESFGEAKGSGDNGGEVVVSEDHLRGGLGNSSAAAHGNTNLGLLQGGSVVDTITGHGSDLVHALQVLDNLGFVEGFHSGEHARILASHLLLRRREVIELSTREGITLGPLLLSEDSNAPANGSGGILVVSSDHDDTDASLLAELDGGSDLHPWGVKHADDSNEGEVHFILSELGSVVQVPVLGVRGRVAGGKGKAPEGVAASTIFDGTLHDLGPQLLCHGHLLAANPNVSATVKHSLGSSLHKHLGSVSDPGLLLRGAVAGHALPVPGELKGKVLLPLGVQGLLHNLGLFQTSSSLGHGIRVNLLSQGDQGSLSGLTNLLKDLLEVVEVNSRVIAHHRDGGHFLQGLKVGTLHLLSVVEDVANWFICGSRDFKLFQVSGLIGESEHLADGHHVGGECAGLVRADNAGATEGLDRWKAPHNCVLGSHPPGSKSKAGGDDSRETFRDGGDGKGDGDLEVVDGSLDPGATVSGVVEVANVDCPHGNADQGDHLGELLAKLVKLLLQGGLPTKDFGSSLK